MLDVTSPFTGEIIESLPTDDASDLENMLATAHGLYRDRNVWLSLNQRTEILGKAAALLKQREADFAELIAREGAKPLKDALIEAKRAAEGIHLCIDHIHQNIGRTIPLGTSPLTAGHRANTIVEPIGVVAAVSAFNHPLNLIVHQVAPAVAAGCPVIIKPAPDTPLSCVAFTDLLIDAGLPAPWCQTLITDDIELAESLVTDARLGFFSFIGSARVGWMLRSMLAPGVRCALEHGGAAPLIVCEDADIDAAIPAIIKGGYYHAGQVCVSVQRVFVADEIKDALIERLVAGIKHLNVGDPLDSATDVGPLIRPGEVDRVEAWVNAAIKHGAQCAHGGQRISDRVFAPTLLVDPPADAQVSTQEIFGPVVCVYGYDDEQTAIDQANALPVAFQAAVFTQDIDRATRIAHLLDASAVMINEHTAFRDDIMPFAGLRESGLGVGGIPYTIDDMQIEKMIVIKSSEIRI